MNAPFLPDALALSAERRPDHAAFRFDSIDLTYGDLVERSNRLANALRADGVGSGDLVGILMGKAIENPIAVYGIQAAGAAYVPIDPSAPAARQAAIVAECGLTHVVTDADRAPRAAALASAGVAHLYGVDRVDEPANLHTVGWDEVATRPASRPRLDRRDDDRAYVIFTSGSTGTPKGIVHTHRSGAAYARMAADLYELDGSDRLSNFPPLHFDQSTFDFFSGPLVGATTVLIGPEHQLVPASLSQLIERERLTVWYSVPLALIQLLLYGVLDERDCTSLRWVIYGGEPFPLKHLTALMDTWPHARFSNCYGPAETNQCTFHHLKPLTPSEVEAGTGVPIGVACPGMETLVVDPDDRPVAGAGTGELAVHSPTMMTGYLGRPDLDARVFLDHGVHAGETRRYYRTGDLVRRSDDGVLHFIGRRDRQIKIRGHRVELDEVEAVLADHEAVEEAAVTATIAGDDGPIIAAHVSVRPGAQLEERALRRHAAAQLPRYALPASVTVVADFPRTTSGKIDYRALATPASSAGGQGA